MPSNDYDFGPMFERPPVMKKETFAEREARRQWLAGRNGGGFSPSTAGMPEVMGPRFPIEDFSSRLGDIWRTTGSPAGFGPAGDSPWPGFDPYAAPPPAGMAGGGARPPVSRYPAGPGGPTSTMGYARVAPGAAPGPRPGGAVLPGMREPFGAVLPGERPRPVVFSITHFDPSWGTPPTRPGLLWNAERYVYEVAGRAGQRSRALDELARLALSGTYLQPYLDEESVPAAWRTRYVRVPTPTPTLGQPYTILADEGAMGVAEQQRLQKEQAAGRRKLVEATPEGRLIERLKAGEQLSDADLFVAGPPKAIAGPPPKQWNLSKYAWIPIRDLPLNCPNYPYPYLPVPLADYASGRWLRGDYTPSIPLPPPYDAVPWRCLVPAGPEEAPVKPRGLEPTPKPETEPDPEPEPEPKPLYPKGGEPFIGDIPNAEPPPDTSGDIVGFDLGGGRSLGTSQDVTYYPAPGLPATS